MHGPDAFSDPRSWEQELHQRLLAGDADASRDGFHYLLTPLLRILESQFPGGHLSADREDCAFDAVTRYLFEPNRFRPGSKPLLGFLAMDAGGDMRNLLRSRASRPHEPLPEEEESVANEPIERNSVENSALREVMGLPPEVTIEELQARVRAVLPSERDRRFLDLRLDGERSTPTLAEVLGLGGAPRAAQEAGVKRAGDRIAKALRRLGKDIEKWITCLKD